MTTVRDVWAAIDKAAPFSSSMSFDNTGILVGNDTQQVTRALIALDITKAVAEEAAALGAQLVISHHPVIFHPLRAVDGESAVASLIRHGIGAIGCHTNLDLADEVGVNVTLCRALGLQNLHWEAEAVLVGETEKTDTYAFARAVKEKLGCDSILVTPIERSVERVAVCSGAGGEFVYQLKGKCDLFLTGEARHDEWIYALDQSLPMVAAGHYHTEVLFAPVLKKYLQGFFPKVDFVISQAERSPAVIL